MPPLEGSPYNQDYLDWCERTYRNPEARESQIAFSDEIDMLIAAGVHVDR